MKLLSLLFILSFPALSFAQQVYIGNGKSYHTRGCIHLKEITDSMSVQQAKEKKFWTCSTCKGYNLATKEIPSEIDVSYTKIGDELVRFQRLSTTGAFMMLSGMALGVVAGSQRSAALTAGAGVLALGGFAIQNVIAPLNVGRAGQILKKKR